MADELAITIGLALKTPLVLEASFPSLFVWAETNEGAWQNKLSPFALLNLDLLVASHDHLCILLRHKNYQSWLDQALKSMEENPDTKVKKEMEDLYVASDDAYMNYIKSSKMKWIISDPFPDNEYILSFLK